LDEALATVREFVNAFPPEKTIHAYGTSGLRGMATSLDAQRPLVRLSTTTSVADDTVPPMLLFKDVASLHQRLVQSERHKDVKYLTGVTKSYEGYLMLRRDNAWDRVRPQLVQRMIHDAQERVMIEREEAGLKRLPPSRALSPHKMLGTRSRKRPAGAEKFIGEASYGKQLVAQLAAQRAAR
jgi:hypothetical protein